jgi:glutamine amidotransferase
MQVLFEASDEDDCATLGLIPGRVTRLKATAEARVPHMGWNDVRRGATSPLLAGVPDDACFYFVHSYRAPDGPWVSAWTEHGGPVPAAVSWGRVHGVQFHPEKSQESGAAVLRSFVAL